MTAVPVRMVLRGLLGKWITVTNPHTHSSWTGKLISYADMPTLEIQPLHGERLSLPLAFILAEAPAPPGAQDQEMEWPADGPAVEYGRPTVYRQPTLTDFRPADSQRRLIAERGDQIIRFAFTRPGTTEITMYEGTVSQDALFRALLRAGLIRREDQ